NLDERITTATERLLRLERQKAIPEYAGRERERRAKRKAEPDARKADAHRKIKLGGLVIEAGVEDWNEAEIVGALLFVGKKLDAEPDKRGLLREAGIQHLTEREAMRKAARTRQ